MKNNMLNYEYTVVGASGFIGQNVAGFLEKKGFTVLKIKRDILQYQDINLGTIIYCAGYGDCNKSPANVVDANLTFLNSILTNCSYNKLLYISSTRVYLEQKSSDEFDNISISKDDPRSLFNLSKLTAESLLEKYENTVSLRVSNVYGDAYNSSLFLPSIVRDAITCNHMDIYTTPDYAKDYINVTDLCQVIYSLSEKNQLNHNVYNVASGTNVCSRAIVETIQQNTNCLVTWHKVNKEDHFPCISIKRLKNEIAFNPQNVIDDLLEMITLFKEKFDE